LNELPDCTEVPIKTRPSSGVEAILNAFLTTPHSDDDVWAPAFDRTIEQPIAGSIPVLKHTRVVITEGNYLLLNDPVWTRARSQLDNVWFYDLDDAVRRKRLINRTYDSANLLPPPRPGSTALISATPNWSPPPGIQQT